MGQSNPLWTQKIVIMNLLEHTLVQEPLIRWCPGLHSTERGKRVAEYRVQYQGKLCCPMNFKTFPRDTQYLKIAVSSHLRLSKVALEFHKVPSLHKEYVTLSSWDVLPLFWEKKQPELRPLSKQYPKINVMIPLRRKGGYYMWNVVLALFLLTLLGFSAAILPVEDISSRLAILGTSVLTTVTFKQIVAQELPKVSYVTSFDRYILLGLFTQMILVAEVCLGQLWEDLDGYFFATAACFWTAATLFIIFRWFVLP